MQQSPPGAPQRSPGSEIGETLRRWRDRLVSGYERTDQALADWYTEHLAPSVEPIARSAARGWQAMWPRLGPAWQTARRVLVALAAGVGRLLPKTQEDGRQGLPGGAIIADRNDDLASIIGRIDTADDIEIVLFVPRAARALRGRGAWPRLAAHVRRRGVTLGVVAARRDVRHLARASGLQAAGSLRALQRQRRRRVQLGAREFDLPAFPVAGLLRWGVMGTVVAGAVAGACYAVPSANIKVAPQGEPFALTAMVSIDPIVDEHQVEGGVLPGITLRRNISTVLATATTGTTSVGDERATVQLVFTNAGQPSVIVPKGTTVVDEEDNAFVTEQSQSIPAGQSLPVAARAERAGTVGNVPAARQWVLSGFPGTLSVANPQPASGGTDVEVPAVAAEDVKRLEDLAPGVLEQISGRELERSVDVGTAFPETVTVAILGQQPFQQVDEPAEMLLMEVTAVVSGLVLEEQRGRAFAEALLAARLPEGRVLLPGTATFELGEQRAFRGGELKLELTASGLVAEEPDHAELVGDAVTGARPGEAAAWLQERLQLERPPEIDISPGWIPWWWLPRRASRISITIVGPPQLEEPAADDSDGSKDGERRESRGQTARPRAAAERSARAVATVGGR